MKDILRYIFAWLLLPLLALRHKVKRVSHYHILRDDLPPLVRDTYPEANEVFETVIETNGFRNTVVLFEVKHDGSERRIRWLNF